MPAARSAGLSASQAGLPALLAIARRSSSNGTLLRSLEPVSTITAAILARGQASGVFAGHLPPHVLARVLQTQCMALLEMTAEQGWHGSERVATLAVLLTAGVPAASAARIAAQIADDDGSPDQLSR